MGDPPDAVLEAVPDRHPATPVMCAGPTGGLVRMKANEGRWTRTTWTRRTWLFPIAAAVLLTMAASPSEARSDPTGSSRIGQGVVVGVRWGHGW